ncbi:MAG: hypothetical protein HUJ71_09075 [Pseudobutyrivibrio sp.]|nr:hypothetical protein [Pseudobutyrivibrio sp.]
MAVSNDGKSLYINSRAEGLIYYDVNNNTSKTVEGIRMYKGDTAAGSLTLSTDDTRLLVRCSDCMLKVLDTSTNEVTDAIELNTGNMDVNALFEELNHQYPNDGLTDRERLRYNVD